MPVQAPDATYVQAVSLTNAPIQTAALTKVSASGNPASGALASGPATAIPLLVASTAAETSRVIDRAGYRGPAALVVANVAGGTPAVTLNIQGSVDNVNFYNVGYALVATPNTVAVAAIAITSSAITTYLLVADQAWRYIRVATSAVTNETTTVTYYQ